MNISYTLSEGWQFWWIFDILYVYIICVFNYWTSFVAKDTLFLFNATWTIRIYFKIGYNYSLCSVEFKRLSVTTFVCFVWKSYLFLMTGESLRKKWKKNVLYDKFMDISIYNETIFVIKKVLRLNGAKQKGSKVQSERDVIWYVSILYILGILCVHCIVFRAKL